MGFVALSQSKIQWLAGIVNDLSEDDFVTFLSHIRPVSTKECAAALGISVRTLERRIAEDPEFPAFRTRGTYTFNLCAVFKHVRGSR